MLARRASEVRGIGCRVIAAADRAVARRIALRDGSCFDPHVAHDLIDRLGDAMTRHRNSWLARSRPGGLEASCAHDEQLIAELRSVTR